jgi:hypothetical protein
MRSPSQDLFALIASMTPEEKRFFKADARYHGNAKLSNNQRLFAWIESQAHYDEAQIKAKFAGELDSNQFAVAKNYLYTSLLKSLSAYLGERGTIRKARQQLKMVEVLFHKELIAQAEKLLCRCMTMLSKHEHPILMLEALDWQRRIWNKRFFQGVAPEALAQHITQVETLIAQAKELAGLQNLHTQFMYDLRTGGFLHSASTLQDRFAHTLSHPLLQVGPASYQLPARLAYYHTWGLYHFMSGRPQEAATELGKLIHDLDQSPEFAYDYFELYVVAHYNYATACLRIDHYAEATRSVGHLDRLKASFYSQKAKLFLCIYLLRVEIFAGTGQMHLALDETLEAQVKMNLYRDLLTGTERVSVGITMAFILFVHQRLRACHQVIRQEMTPEIVAGNPDLHIAVEIMRMALYFELAEDDLLSQTYRAFQRFVHSRPGRYKLEMEMMRDLQQFQRQADIKAERTFFKALHTRYISQKRDPQEQRPVEYFNFEVWIRSKADGVSMLETIDAMAPAREA